MRGVPLASILPLNQPGLPFQGHQAYPLPPGLKLPCYRMKVVDLSLTCYISDSLSMAFVSWGNHFHNGAPGLGKLSPPTLLSVVMCVFRNIALRPGSIPAQTWT